MMDTANTSSNSTETIATTGKTTHTSALCTISLTHTSAHVIRLVEDHLERSEATSRERRLGHGGGVSLMFLKRDLELGLRWMGVRVVEFCAKPQRVVVGFEDEGV